MHWQSQWRPHKTGLGALPMSFLPRDPFQRRLFAGFLCFFAVSCLNPPYLDFMLMQHVPTIASLAFLVYVVNHLAVSRLSYSLTILFLVLHTIGARYLYSNTPYDDWAYWLTGRTVSETLGLTRNHYDRVVHFSFGLLMTVPIQELERRYLKLSRAMSCLLAIEFVIAMSAVYEMIEWLVALVFAPDWSESFLGQQGDAFDGQKDMALATLGSMISISIVALTGNRGTCEPVAT
jgi:putative membrane protein